MLAYQAPQKDSPNPSARTATAPTLADIPKIQTLNAGAAAKLFPVPTPADPTSPNGLKQRPHTGRAGCELASRDTQDQACHAPALLLELAQAGEIHGILHLRAGRILFACLARLPCLHNPLLLLYLF